MWISKIICALFILGVSLTEAQKNNNKGLCIQPEVENGEVNIISETGNVLVANVTCSSEYQLVGKKVIKCQRGVWSSKVPICTRMGGCEVRDLPDVENSRRIIVKPFRGNVVKYRCRTHYRLFGQNMFNCGDGGKWAGGEPPVCTRSGCDESAVHQIPYGTSKKMMHGALYQFNCDEGSVLSGSPTIFCDGKNWNDTIPTCLIPPERLTVEGPDELTPDYEARFTCKASASNLPSKLTFKLTSHHSDLLDELIDSGLVEIEEPKEKWIEQERQNDGGAPGWASSRSLILKTELLKRAAQLGEQITFECQIPDPYHERRILISATKFVTLHNPIPAIELQLKISGPSEVRYNEPAQFRCSANRDDIEWTMALDQQKMKMGFGSGEFLLKPGQLQDGINQFVLECSGLDDNNDKVTISHYVNVLYAPGKPEITPGKAVVTPGNEQKLTCESKAGNPPAKLNWYKNSEMIDSQYSLEGDMVKAEVTIVAGPEDNGSELRCEATNSAVSKPVSETITIELLPESTTAKQEYESKTSEADVIREQKEHKDYDGYDDEIYTYDYMNEIDSQPELQTNIFTGISRPKPATPIRSDVENRGVNSGTKKEKLPVVSSNEVYPNEVMPRIAASSPATLSLSFSCLILAFLLHH